ncbi:MAG: DUF3352 domain-containing protein [Bacteroidetes bacterium]|nr:DUF3352 domain-containing protein [Bacteroidota bacterium]
MRHFKKAFLILGIVILVAGIGYLSWTLYQKFQGETESPLKAISENTALIIQLNRPSELSQDLFRESLIWKELTIIPYLSAIKKEFGQIDSLLRNSKELTRITRKYPLYLAMTMTGHSSYGFLILTSIPGSNGEDLVTAFLEDSFKDKVTIMKNQYGSANLVRVIMKGKRDPFYFAVRKGVFMGSGHPQLVTKAIDQLSLNIPSLSGSGFQKVETTTGKKVDANIYINYSLIRPFVSSLLQSDQENESFKATRFADWSGLDVILKKDEMLINGFTTTADTGNQFLSIFAGQSPQKTGMTSILPDNISRFAWFGFNSIGDFYRNLQSFSSRNPGYIDTYTGLQDFESREQIAVKDFFLPWMGTEICMARALNNPETLREDCYAIAKVNDRPLADSLLAELGKMFPKKKDSVTYHEIPIRFLPLQELFPGLFGVTFADVHSTCYTFINDYIIFGNDQLALKDFIDHYFYGKVLDKDKTFQAVSENISDNANVFYYFNTERSHTLLSSAMSDDLKLQVEPVFDSLKKFESVALQFSAKGNIFYTNLFIHYNPVSGVQGPLQWQAALDSAVIGMPQILPCGSQGKKAVFAFDLTNHLYMIDSAGTIAWKLAVPGKPVSQLLEFPVHKPDTFFFIFNTETHLCLVNSAGRFIEGYPVRLPAKATAGLTLSGTDKANEFRVYIPLADNKVHAFSVDGKTAPGWQNPGMLEEISQPVKVLRNGKTDFIFIKGKNGHLLVTERKGKPVMRSGKNISVSPNNQFYINNTNRKGLFLTTDPTGKVLYFQASGKTSEATFNLFSNNHRFFYEDINDDGTYEFIFYDRNRIYYYNRFYRLIYSYTFRHDITIPPFIISLPDGKKWIGAVSGAANEIYLFGINGVIEIQPGIRGNTGFTVGKNLDQSGLNLIIGSGKILKNYLLPE